MALEIACLLKRVPFLTKLGFHRDASEPFLVLAGSQTSDGDTAHVPSQVAQGLGIPQATFVQEVKLDSGHVLARRIVEGGDQLLRVPLPCLVAIAGAVRHLASMKDSKTTLGLVGEPRRAEVAVLAR